jgi:peptidoglycan-N-acetylglucosamine deacetylase
LAGDWQVPACDNVLVNPWLIGVPVALTAAAAAISYGAVNPRSHLFGPAVWRTNSARKLAITFDDGPNPQITPRLLEILDRYHARATFFVVGRFARECSSLLKEIKDRGHLIGNHTDTHANLFWRTPSQIHAEIQSCNEAISTVTNVKSRWFRPPWGMRNPWVISAAAAEGLCTVLWSNLPGDWRPKPVTWLEHRMEPIAKRAQARGVATESAGEGAGDILCLHDGDYRFLNADRHATLAALEYWLPRWRDLGLNFVTIDDAVSDPA